MLALKFQGLEYKEIAYELGIKTQSVKNQMHWALSVTGAKNVMELLVWYIAAQEAVVTEQEKQP